MDDLQPFTVIYTEPGIFIWQGFNCMAENGDHAEEQCLDAYPDCEIVWINEGHDNFNCEDDV